MNKNDINITFFPYFNDITIHLCEDTAFTESVREKFGTDVNKDYFLVVPFLYPFDMVVTCEDKYALMELLTPTVTYGPLNRPINPLQPTTCDRETALFLAAHTKEELLNVSTIVCDKALELLKKSLLDVFIRIGTGTLENSLTGTGRTCQDSLRAVNTREKFKKEHRVLDFIRMEIYSAINATVPVHGQSLISTILLQLADEGQTILRKYYKRREQVPAVVTALHVSEAEVRNALCRVKGETGLDVNDTGDNFKLNFIMITKGVLEKEKKRR